MDRLIIRNFQSLKSVDLDLGKLTVIVGPSSSGKTALVRALRALTSNVRGSDFVSRGSKAAAISALVGDSQVVLLRGEGKGEYRVRTALDQGDTPEEVFTKLAGGVPEKVTEVLGIPPKSLIHFAGQFDPPYLLTATGSEIARHLGELTNVSTILEGVREARRRCSSANSSLKVRKADLANLKEKAAAYSELPSQLQRLAQAEEQLKQVDELQFRVDRLRSLVTDQEVALGILAREDAKAPPSFDPIATAQSRLSRLKELLAQLSRYSAEAKAADNRRVALEDEEPRLHEQLHNLLEEAGTCPTCGQEVGKV